MAKFPKTAKHILGIANIIIGIEQKNDNTLKITGLQTFIDQSDIHNKLKKYIPDKLKYVVRDFEVVQ